jgi:hypothetical protein
MQAPRSFEQTHKFVRYMHCSEPSETRRTVPDMHEPLSCYTVTVTVGCDGSYLRDPAAFMTAAARRPGASLWAAARSYRVTTRKVRLGYVHAVCA